MNQQNRQEALTKWYTRSAEQIEADKEAAIAADGARGTGERAQEKRFWPQRRGSWRNSGGTHCAKPDELVGS